MAVRRVSIIGAGGIAQAHAEALRLLPGVDIASVVDPHRGAARAFAERWGVRADFGSVDDMLAAGRPDCAHVLVPPDRHVAVARQLVAAGVPVLLEKPLGVSAAECRLLLQEAAAAGVMVGVNQNMVHHPAFRRLRRALAGDALGRVRGGSCIFNMPLRQLAARQLGHWMFHEPKNILLEQAVHPLSQILALVGQPVEVAVLPEPPLDLAPGVQFQAVATIALSCVGADGSRVPVQMRFAVGQEFPVWELTAVCDDGMAVADMRADRCVVVRRSRWPEFTDDLLAGSRAGGRLIADSLGNASAFLRSLLRLGPPSGWFFASMSGGIADFHRALGSGRAPECDGAFGLALVECCERIAAAGFAPRRAAPPPTPAVRAVSPATPAPAYDVAVIGGTGFIGRHVVARLLEAGYSVGVMARNVANLPAVFSRPGVTVLRGDARRREDVERVVGQARLVVNLAHGGGSGSAAEVTAAMLGSAELVAQVCLARGVARLVHVGSIASLYLGDGQAVITGTTPPDPQPDRRGVYARAKALADTLLLEMHRRDGLPVCILRPGVVVGEGSSPFHSGVGFYNAEQHCIGWNRGDNPLPFVLADDVAQAVAAALTAPDAVGRCYNLAGDVAMTAREYIAELARALRRPLRFHPQDVRALWTVEAAKWLIKCAAGRRAPLVSLRDLKSRGMPARFDTADAKRDLGWRPVADRAAFVAAAIAVHAPAPPMAEPAERPLAAEVIA